MWTLQLAGSSDVIEDEHDVIEYLRRVLNVFDQEGSPVTIHNAVFVGSHTNQHNLLSNPEGVEEEVAQPPAPEPEPRQKWDTNIPSEVQPFPEAVQPGDEVVGPFNQVRTQNEGGVQS